MQELLTLEEFRKRGLLKEGTWFEQKLDPNANFILRKKLTGFWRDQIVKNQAEETHFFMYTEVINDGNDVKLLGEPSDCMLGLKGISGSRNAISIIDTFCSYKFGIPGEIESQSISIAEQEKLPPKLKYGIYWLPEVSSKKSSNVKLIGVRYCTGGAIDTHFLVLDGEDLENKASGVRPINLIRGSNIRILVDKEHTGKRKDKAYLIATLMDLSKEMVPMSKKNENLTVEEFREQVLLEEGAWFKLHLNPQVYSELRKNITGYLKIQEIRNQAGETCLFRYSKALSSSEKEITLLGEPVDCNLYLAARKGYEMGALAINSFCGMKFGFQDEIEARSITWEEQDELPNFLQYGEYWLPKTYSNGKYLGMQCVINNQLSYVCLYIEKNEEKKQKGAAGCDCNSVRPVISLYGKNIKITVGEIHDGKSSDTAYDIVVCE